MKIKNYDFLQIPNFFLQGIGSKKMDHLEMLIYLYLATYCFGEKTSCFPTQERISKDLGIALSTVKEKIKFMIIRRIITITGKSRGGRSKWNTYELTPWDELQFLDDWYNIRSENKSRINARSFDEQPQGGLLDNVDANQPLEELPNGHCNSHQTAINNSKSIIISNNKILASSDADIFQSLSKDTDDKDNLILPKEKINKFSEKETIRSSSKRVYNNRYKPRDITNMFYPNASLKEIKDKTYYFFKENGYDVHGHANKLYDLSEKLLPELIKGFSFLDYWKDYQYGDNSLTMYVRNLSHFIDTVEGQRFIYERQWEDDNLTLLVDEYIQKNNVYDVRLQENQERILNISKRIGEIDTGNRLQTSWLICSPHNVSYCAGHLVATGDHIPHEHVRIISNEVVDKILTQYEKMISDKLA